VSPDFRRDTPKLQAGIGTLPASACLFRELYDKKEVKICTMLEKQA
jgi:hypothetical protein